MTDADLAAVRPRRIRGEPRQGRAHPVAILGVDEVW